MYELFKSNEQDESLALIKENMGYKEAMEELHKCSLSHCQIEEYRDGKYALVATKHNGKIIKYY